MRLRRFIFALLLCVNLSLFAATPSPTPTPTAKPAPPLKPTGPVKPLEKPSPTLSAKPSASAKPKPSVSPDSSPSASSPTSTPRKSSQKSSPKPTPALKPDAELDGVAEEYIRGFLAARPLQATALGFHEYDGRINEDTRLAIDAEIARLKRFDDRLTKFDPAKLGPRAVIDLRLLQVAVKKELFQIQDFGMYD